MAGGAARKKYVAALKSAAVNIRAERRIIEESEVENTARKRYLIVKNLRVCRYE